ncbi:unnamed protein product [Clavelina lepadiformis]|uniref:Uncharacterized protein n=1 Tax=Clavelina lepadiformis TaxID=159417 RepID=A0ABP0F2S4_CLALP
MIGVVPLVVLAELQGLAQGSTGITEHAIKVKEIAAMVVEFLQQRFFVKTPLKAPALTNRFCSRSGWIRVTKFVNSNPHQA